MGKIRQFALIPPERWVFSTHPDVMAARVRADEYLARHGSYDGAERQIEEFVRQWTLLELVETYGYPPEWFGERLVIEEPVKMGSSEKEADISLRNSARRAFLYVENVVRGASEVLFTEKQRQLESYLAATHTATVGMITDGDTTKVVRKKVDPNDFDYIADIPSYGAETATRARLAREVPADTADTRTTGLKSLTGGYEKRLFDCHSAIRDVDGLHADEALDELCKVLYAKIYDERSVLNKAAGTEFKFRCLDIGAQAASSEWCIATS